MPHEPTREDASARHLVEAASVFAKREMLTEARQALQSARAALTLRSDVGPAHWCDACLVALEIAARDGDVQEMESEAAQLRSLSGAGRYWAEQARARICEHAGRLGPARLDRVFAVLAGEASPAAPRHESPPSPDCTYSSIAHTSVPASPEPTTPQASALHAAPAESHAKPHAELDVDMPAFSLEVTLAPSSTGTELPAEHHATPLPLVELASAGILLVNTPPPPPPSATHAMAHDAERVTESPLLKRPAIRLPRFGVEGALLVVLVLPPMLWASRTVTGVSSVLPRSSTPAAEPPRRTEKPLQFASALPEAGEAPSHKRLLLGHALLAAGDTAGAVAAFAQAAQGDSRGALAWNAAETLARLPGHSASAADAYILAYAAGLPAHRAETVARAQELAGRPDRARRVRDQSVARYERSQEDAHRD
jgi:hypothetical protein